MISSKKQNIVKEVDNSYITWNDSEEKTLILNTNVALTDVLFEAYLRPQLINLYSELSKEYKFTFQLTYGTVLHGSVTQVIDSVPSHMLKKAIIYCGQCLNPEFARLTQMISRGFRKNKTEDKDNGKN